jgi:hypothetical protein
VLVVLGVAAVKTSKVVVVVAVGSSPRAQAPRGSRGQTDGARRRGGSAAVSSSSSSSRLYSSSSSVVVVGRRRRRSLSSQRQRQ